MSSDKRLCVKQTPLFGRKIKKFKKNEKEALDQEVKRLLSDLEIGQEKKGDLQGVRVHKCSFNQQEILIAYSFTGEEFLLITIGPRENYYKDLKHYLH